MVNTVKQTIMHWFELSPCIYNHHPLKFFTCSQEVGQNFPQNMWQKHVPELCKYKSEMSLGNLSIISVNVHLRFFELLYAVKLLFLFSTGPSQLPHWAPSQQWVQTTLFTCHVASRTPWCAPYWIWILSSAFLCLCCHNVNFYY